MNQYSTNNSISRKELSDFSVSLTKEQLTHVMPAGWTVSAVLAHVSFWDFRALTLLKKWQVEGISTSPNDVDIVNEATRPFLAAIAPNLALQITLKYAQELDELIDSLDPKFLKDVEEQGKTVRLDRAHHRQMHIAEIKSALGLN